MQTASRVPALIGWVLLFGTVPVAGQGNNAEIRVGESFVPGSLAAGETAGVRVKVYNNGGTTWPAGTLHRLGAEGSNQVLWGGWGPCGGYANGPTDARIFLCNDVLPGGSYEFVFNVTVPAGASGSVRLGVGMVQDAVEGFGQSYTWKIPRPGPRPPAPIARSPRPTIAGNLRSGATGIWRAARSSNVMTRRGAPDSASTGEGAGRALAPEATTSECGSADAPISRGRPPTSSRQRRTMAFGSGWTVIFSSISGWTRRRPLTGPDSP